MARKFRAKVQLPPSVTAAISQGAGSSMRKLVTIQDTSSITAERLAPPPPSEVDALMFRCYKELLTAYREAPFFLSESDSPAGKGPQVERYSDKYRQRIEPTKISNIPFVDPGYFPEELQSVFSSSSAKRRNQIQRGDRILEKLVDIDEATKESSEEEGDQEEVLLDEDEEELEDENDYCLSYFDNGEEFDNDGGGADDGPTY
jgi:DNA-directed RNA polymerase III subunit RPC7